MSPRLVRLLALTSLVACTGASPDADDGPDEETGWDLATTAPFAPPQADPLEGTGVEGCAVIDEARCDGTTRQVCAPYDPAEDAFVDAPELLHRAWLFDRWYDVYHSPDGQTSDRESEIGFVPGTPESEWGDPAHFGEWDGFGDSAIWTGVATHGAMLRWLETGTEADRQRFEDKVRTVLTQFEITDAVGYLARAHFLALPDDVEPSADHLTLTETQADDEIRFVARDPSVAPDLPEAYSTGLPDGEGSTVQGTIMWQGNPSIDQYTGAMVALPAAWSLLDDPDLKDRIEAQLVGYLHRLERVELINLQDNPEVSASAAALLSGGVEVGDDLDVENLDTIVAYVLPAYNHTNEDTYPRQPPEDFPREATTVIDASSPTFLPELLSLTARLSKGFTDGIDHIYAPSVRGGDAVHMMHLGLMAWHMTGEARYRDWVEDDLIGALSTHRVANTLGALVPPPWCRSFYGDHITLPPLWALLNLVDGGELEGHLVEAMDEEGYGRLSYDLGNAKFDLMIADHLPVGDPRIDALQAEAMTLLSDLGGNGGLLDDPRRTYTLTVDDLQDALGDELTLRCPTEAEVDQCEAGYAFAGVTLPGEDISEICTDTELDCPISGDRCTWALAEEALPPSLRTWEDFAWQRNPWSIGAFYGEEGRKSSPGLDLTESYWLARVRDVTTEGDGLVLAWQDDGACTP